jgi:hypothetical protein
VSAAAVVFSGSTTTSRSAPSIERTRSRRGVVVRRSHTTEPGLIGTDSARTFSGRWRSKTRPQSRRFFISATSRPNFSRRAASSIWAMRVSILAMEAFRDDGNGTAAVW